MPRIKVEQRHIDNGKPCRASFCPLALAISEAFGGDRIAVSFGRVDWVYDEIKDGAIVATRVSKSVRLPDVARIWYQDFDIGDEVRPIEFDLDEPTAVKE